MEQLPVFTALVDQAGIGWNLGRLVAERYRGKALLDGVRDPFSLLKFASAGRCTAKLASDDHACMRADWSRAGGLRESPVQAIYEVAWEGRSLRVVIAQWWEGHEPKKVSLVVADTMEDARAFATAASVFGNDPGKAILRFTSGCWAESGELWSSVQRASFDDLVLANDLKSEIIRDFTSFLAARGEYERHGVPWKRGVLLVGPPGNGKTHCVRALIKLLGVPCLYVQSLQSRYGEEASNIENVFARAKEVSPCCLVFEDLDAMIHDKNRSVFLNQLDGLESAPGLVTIATTNHAERLDPAIVERPSRFDRKYHFGLPGAEERRAYLALWNAKMSDAMRVDDAGRAALVAATDEFSFAYLKELYLSSMMRWMSERGSGSSPRGMRAVLDSQVSALREQMRAGASAQASIASAPKADAVAEYKEAMGLGSEG